MSADSKILWLIFITMVAMSVIWKEIQPRIDCAIGVKSACAVLEQHSSPKGHHQ